MGSHENTVNGPSASFLIPWAWRDLPAEPKVPESLWTGEEPMASELAPEALRVTCDATRLTLDLTAEPNAPMGITGQPRATAALQFGLGMSDGGYHIFVAGPFGTGKMTAVNAFLAEAASQRSV